MNNVNYQKKLEEEIAKIITCKTRPKLLLHSCCAPCSSYCLVYLRKWFDITCFYFNPNITEEEEYYKRVNELYRLAASLNDDPIYIDKGSDGVITFFEGDRDYLDTVGTINVIESDFDPITFKDRVTKANLCDAIEGGERCKMCFGMRLSEALRVANEGQFDYFTTSLTISPLKNAELLNTIGEELARNNDGSASWLYSDFKKKNGYKISTQLSDRYSLYRQNYCGCEYSKR